MTDQPKIPDAKTLEMRVAELEDKLSKTHVTEDEMKAFQKVSALIGAQPAITATAGQRCMLNNCITPQGVIFHCIQSCITYNCSWYNDPTRIIRQCGCINECGGGCIPGGGGAGGGGFGGLGG